MRLHRSRARGFTLIELLIVIAIIGMLAAMAIAGYRKYVHAAQGSEAKVVMGMIRNGEEAYRVETLSYLGCSSTLATYWPNPTPNDSRWVWERSADTAYTKCWAMLNVHPDAPVRYGYALTAGVFTTGPSGLDADFKHPPTWPTSMSQGTPWFVVAARNAHNGKPPSLAVTSSWDGIVYTEGDSD